MPSKNLTDHPNSSSIIPTHHPTPPPLFLASNANAQTVPRHFYKRLHFDSVMSPATWRSKAEAAGFQVEHWEDLSHLAERDGWEVINLPTGKPKKIAWRFDDQIEKHQWFPLVFQGRPMKSLIKLRWVSSWRGGGG